MLKKLKCTFIYSVLAVSFIFHGSFAVAGNLYSDTLDQLLQAVRSKNYSKVVELSVLAFKLEPTPQLFDRRVYEDFKNQLTLEDSAFLVRAFENDAPEKLKPDFNAKVKELDGLNGELNQSAVFYFLKNSLENYYLNGAQHSKLWIHRNPAPGDYRVFIIAQGGGFRMLNWPTHTVYGIQFWKETLTVNKQIEISVGGKWHKIKALPKAELSSTLAMEHVLKLTEKQRDIDYSRVCKDGALRSLFVFGHGQKPAWQDLLRTLSSEEAWDSVTTTEVKARHDGGLQDVLLSELKNADYIVKGAHGSGSSAFMKVVRQGFVKKFKRAIPVGLGISARCGGRELLEEVTVIYPDDQFEKQSYSKVNIVPRDFLNSVLDINARNGGQAILFDTACSGTPVIKRLYADFIRMSSTDPRVADFKLSIFHSPMKQKTVGYFPGGSLRWMSYVGLRIGFSFDQIFQLPHDEVMQYAETEERFLDPIIHGPGTNAYTQNRELFNEIAAMSTARGVETDVGTIRVEIQGQAQAEEF